MRCQFLVSALVLVAIGCGGMKLVPVSGRVTLDNKPLVNADVIFQPDSLEKNPGHGSRGKTDDQGQFTLQLTTGNTKGATVGKHKVTITAYAETSSGSDPRFRKRIALAESTFEVLEEGTSSADFDLTSLDSKKK